MSDKYPIDWLNKVNEKNLVVITGYYGFDNLGDEAILEELLNELQQLVERDRIVVLSNNPEKTTRLYNTRSVSRWRVDYFIALMNKACVLISGGGGLFQDTNGIRSVVFYGIQIILARIAQAKVLIYAQGVGPLNRAIGKFLTKQTWKLANFISVRDKQSEQTVKRWGLTAELTADPVWLLQETPLSNKSEVLDRLGPMRGLRPIIGISLRPSKNFGEDALQLLPEVLADSLPADSIFLMLPLKKNSDYPLLQDLAKHLEKLGRPSVMFAGEPDMLPSQWLAVIKNVDLLIGMRFHALLMALKNGKPTVGIAYDPKVTSLLNSFRQPIIDLDFVKPDRDFWIATVRKAFLSRLELGSIAQIEGEKIQKKSCGNSKILKMIINLANS